MTCFSADFPASFSARILDVVMCGRCEAALLKVAVALLGHCGQTLLGLRDLEHILSHLKLRLPGAPPPPTTTTSAASRRRPPPPVRTQTAAARFPFLPAPSEPFSPLSLT